MRNSFINMNNTWAKSSCSNCEKRHPGCHSTCTDYINFKKDIEDQKAQIAKTNVERNAFDARSFAFLQLIRRRCCVRNN